MAQTVYSNVVNIRLSGQEMVLEFGAVFPDAPPVPGKPVQFEPDIRVVMGLSGLKPYVEALENALKALEQAQAQAQVVVPHPSSGQVASK
jgi:hypothetical protein